MRYRVYAAPGIALNLAAIHAVIRQPKLLRLRWLYVRGGAVRCGAGQHTVSVQR